MSPRLLFPAAAAALVLLAPATDPPSPAIPAPAEALERARLLHAAFSGSLQVMHRDFFRRDTHKTVPSESLASVFKSIADSSPVTLRWLADDETIMNPDHKPKDAFEHQALAAITAGKSEFSTVADGRLRFAGSILLGNACLKCHVSGRRSLEDRFSALEISLPARQP